MGESTSDWLVHTIQPVAAVGLGFAGFLIALALQFSMRRYVAWAYWTAVVMVGVFGTMAADVLHVGFHVPYFASASLYAVVLAAVFISWQKTEKTLSIHSIDSCRREAFYWAAVVATFALGTAAGDLSAYTFHLGYLHSRAAVRRRDVDPRGRLPLLQPQSDPRVLVRVRADAPARRLVRRLVREALERRRGRPRRRENQPGAHLGDRRLVAHLAATRKDVQGERAPSQL